MCIIQGYRSYPFQRVGQVENDPSKGAGCKVQCTAFKAGGDIHGSILCLLVYIVGCLCEIGGEVCYEIKTDGQYNESDDERLYYISFRDGQYQREEVEHSGQRRQRQELVTRQDDSQQYGYGNQQQGNHQRCRMADNQCGAHTDVQADSTFEFLAISSRVASEMGFKPSMNKAVIRGISSITAPILIPKPNI